MLTSLFNNPFFSRSAEADQVIAPADARYGLFFVYVVLSLSINDVLVLFAKFFGVDVLAAPFNWFSSVLYFVVTFVFMMRLGLHYRDFGFTFKNSKQSIKEGSSLALVSVILFTLVSLLGHHFLAWPSKFVSQGFKGLFSLSSVAYFAHVILQEVGFRGLYMGSLYRFMNKMHPFLVIVLSSLVFAVLHAHLGLFGFLAAFFSSLLFGYLYLRHQNLMGVIILHFVLGLILFNFILTPGL